ncbi:MAG: PmeII family type II restriction endonuclease [Candidatus Daviesbacteria bacterium]|nr:PmeII family type II restriction endonuclease [Candidatus Daviesbacteria bacterium]
MDQELKKQILNTAVKFFKEKFVKSHVSKIQEVRHLKSFDYTAFYVDYLANFLTGNNSPKSLAKALIYPRILATSPSTIFGTVAQKFCSTLQGVLGSTTTGMDLEFIDQIDKRYKFAQIKLGMSTINSKDVAPMIEEFRKAKRLAMQNNRKVLDEDFMVGVLFGSYEGISQNYKNIEKQFPVYVGKDFWLRLTGDENFYNDLINELGKLAKQARAKKKLEEAVNTLADEIEDAIGKNTF